MQRGFKSLLGFQMSTGKARGKTEKICSEKTVLIFNDSEGNKMN